MNRVMQTRPSGAVENQAPIMTNGRNAECQEDIESWLIGLMLRKIWPVSTRSYHRRPFAAYQDL